MRTYVCVVFACCARALRACFTWAYVCACPPPITPKYVCPPSLSSTYLQTEHKPRMIIGVEFSLSLCILLLLLFLFLFPNKYSILHYQIIDINLQIYTQHTPTTQHTPHHLYISISTPPHILHHCILHTTCQTKYKTKSQKDTHYKYKITNMKQT